MSVSTKFKNFCENIRISDSDNQKIINRYHQITKRINLDYYNSDSDVNHSLYIGSYGRDTEIFTSDIDMLVQLPYEAYQKYNNYTGNGQSALLQDVKNTIAKTYSTTHLKGDGQIVSINWVDNINFEILPTFINKDGSYTYPDSNGGGRWRTSDPKSEIKAIKEMNDNCNNNQNRTFEVYSSSLSTDKKSYKEAQKSLKTEEEQTFSEKEIDVMLPSSIRRETREFKEK